MYRIDNATAVSPIPTPGPVGPNPDSFFSDGVTVLPADWLNAVQEELSNVVEDTGATLDKTDRTQLLTAIEYLITNGVYGQLNDNNLFQLECQLSSGTGGANSTGGWDKLVLNTTKVNNIAGASVASSVVTLPAGTYIAPFFAVGYGATASRVFKFRVYDTTNAATLGVSAPARTVFATFGNNQVSVGFARFTLAGAANVELQGQMSAAETNGWGYPAAAGEVEVYRGIKFFKVG